MKISELKQLLMCVASRANRMLPHKNLTLPEAAGRLSGILQDGEFGLLATDICRAVAYKTKNVHGEEVVAIQLENGYTLAYIFDKEDGGVVDLCNWEIIGVLDQNSALYCACVLGIPAPYIISVFLNNMDIVFAKTLKHKLKHWFFSTFHAKKVSEIMDEILIEGRF